MPCEKCSDCMPLQLLEHHVQTTDAREREHHEDIKAAIADMKDDVSALRTWIIGALLSSVLSGASLLLSKLLAR